jgi:hypothetical protein
MGLVVRAQERTVLPSRIIVPAKHIPWVGAQPVNLTIIVHASLSQYLPVRNLYGLFRPRDGNQEPANEF